MNELLPYIIKSTSILLLLLVYYKLFLRRQTFFRLNRFYLLGTLLIAVVAPFISIEIKSVSETIAPPIAFNAYFSNILDEVYVIGNYTHEQISPSMSDFQWIALIYSIGVLFFLTRYIFAIAQIIQLKYKHPHKRFHKINFIILPPSKASFSFFNNLFICHPLTTEDRHKIFEHEKIHINQYHCLDLLIAELICISNWFNPLVWLCKKAIIENHEYIADQQVLLRFQTGSYLELLVRQAFKGAFSFTNNFSCSNLKKRTIMMTKKQSNRYLALSFIPIAAILVTLLYGFTYNKVNATNSDAIQPEQPSLVNTPVVPENLTFVISPKDTSVCQTPAVMPTFPGGNVQKWITQNIKYPPVAADLGIQGKVFVQFIIEKDGSITDVRVVRGVDPSIDSEAVRVIKNMPKWKPGTTQGKPVRVSYTLPINFQMSFGFKEKTPELFYTNFMKKINEAEKKLNTPSLLSESDKAPIGNKWEPKDLNDQQAYEKMLKEKEIETTLLLSQAKQAMNKINFSEDEQQKVMEVYRQQLSQSTTLIKNIGADNFIEKYSALPVFKTTQPMTEANIALIKNLSPEKHKQLILHLYFFKSEPLKVIQDDEFLVVEKMPAFRDGTLDQWLAKNIKYPASAIEKKIQGKVFVQFVVNKDGSITDIKVIRGIDPDLDAEAIRVVKAMPKWTPGEQKGVPVRVRYTFPVTFKLSE